MELTMILAILKRHSKKIVSITLSIVLLSVIMSIVVVDYTEDIYDRTPEEALLFSATTSLYLFDTQNSTDANEENQVLNELINEGKRNTLFQSAQDMSLNNGILTHIIDNSTRELTFYDLDRQLSQAMAEGTNVLQITARDISAENAVELANTAADQISLHLPELIPELTEARRVDTAVNKYSAEQTNRITLEVNKIMKSNSSQARSEYIASLLMIILLGFAFGLIASFSIAFLTEYMNSSTLTAQQVAELLDTKIITAISKKQLSVD